MQAESGCCPYACARTSGAYFAGLVDPGGVEAAPLESLRSALWRVAATTVSKVCLAVLDSSQESGLRRVAALENPKSWAEREFEGQDG